MQKFKKHISIYLYLGPNAQDAETTPIILLEKSPSCTFIQPDVEPSTSPAKISNNKRVSCDKAPIPKKINTSKGSDEVYLLKIKMINNEIDCRRKEHELKMAQLKEKHELKMKILNLNYKKFKKKIEITITCEKLIPDMVATV